MLSIDFGSVIINLILVIVTLAGVIVTLKGVSQYKNESTLDLSYRFRSEIGDTNKPDAIRIAALEAYILLCKERGCRVDIRRMDMSNMTIDNIDLRNSRLDRTNWRGAKFQKVDLGGACVEGADFSEADFDNQSTGNIIGQMKNWVGSQRDAGGVRPVKTDGCLSSEDNDKPYGGGNFHFIEMIGRMFYF